MLINRNRFGQIISWLGRDFDGLLLFDESHKGKNLLGNKPSQMGEKILKLQQDLPKARVVYSSATGASEPINMCYMDRLGLWGKGTPFPANDDDSGFGQFQVAVERGGLGMMELVAMHLRKEGTYICRTLSFRGYDFIVDEDAVDPTVLAVYDEATKLWQDLFVELQQLFNEPWFLDREKGGFPWRDNDGYGNPIVNTKGWSDNDLHKPLTITFKGPENDAAASKKVIMPYFWGAHQRFFKSLILSTKVAAVVRVSKEALAAGKSVVIGLQSTGEAATEQAMESDDAEEDDRGTDLIAACKEIVMRLRDRCSPLPGDKKEQKGKGKKRKQSSHAGKGARDNPEGKGGRLMKKEKSGKWFEDDSGGEDSDEDEFDDNDDDGNGSNYGSKSRRIVVDSSDEDDQDNGASSSSSSSSATIRPVRAKRLPQRYAGGWNPDEDNNDDDDDDDDDDDHLRRTHRNSSSSSSSSSSSAAMVVVTPANRSSSGRRSSSSSSSSSASAATTAASDDHDSDGIGSGSKVAIKRNRKDGNGDGDIDGNDGHVKRYRGDVIDLTGNDDEVDEGKLEQEGKEEAQPQTSAAANDWGRRLGGVGIHDPDHPGFDPDPLYTAAKKIRDEFDARVNAMALPP